MIFINAKRKQIFGCFIDFSSAFDSVWHSGLWHKLYSCGISSKIITILKSKYSKSVAYVRKEGAVSRFFKCTNGTRQGCSLSPTLCKMYLIYWITILLRWDSYPFRADYMLTMYVSWVRMRMACKSLLIVYTYTVKMGSKGELQ